VLTGVHFIRGCRRLQSNQQSAGSCKKGMSCGSRSSRPEARHRLQHSKVRVGLCTGVDGY
jgi:hypothetical protein